MRRLSRRQFLVAMGTAAAGLVAGCARKTPRVSAPASRELWITPNDRFYRQQYYFSVPRVDMTKWQLVIDGLVKKPLMLRPDDLKMFKLVEAMRTLECLGNRVGGEQIGNAVWQGFWFKELLDQVGVDPRATRARFEAVDGYTTALDVAWLKQPAGAPANAHSRLVMACADKTVKVVGPGENVLNTLTGHTDWVYAVAASPDGLRFASGSGDGTVKVWGAAGKLLATLTEEAQQ